METVIAFILSCAFIIAGLLCVAKSRHANSSRTISSSHRHIDDYERHAPNRTQKYN